VSSFAQQIDNGPVVLPLLQVVQPQADRLMPSQAACQEQSKKGSIPLSLYSSVIGRLPKLLALFGCQPVPKAHAQLLDAFDTANTGRKVGTEKATVGGFIGEAAYSTQAQVDGA
jgi:hypothetical protein